MAKTQEELSLLKTEYENLKIKLNELNEEELKQVVGGDDGPEEFDWRGTEYFTPRKKNPSGSYWKFSAIGNTDGQYFKIITEGAKQDSDLNDK